MIICSLINQPELCKLDRFKLTGACRSNTFERNGGGGLSPKHVQRWEEFKRGGGPNEIIDFPYAETGSEGSSQCGAVRIFSQKSHTRHDL